MTSMSFKNIRTSVFIVRTVLVLSLASLVAEMIFHASNGWNSDSTVWRMVVESFLIITIFTPLLWWYVLRPLRQVTEEASQKTELQLLSLMEATLESTADGIVVLDTQLQVVRYNQKYLEMWGALGGVFAQRDAHRIFEQIREYLIDPEQFFQQSLRAYSDHDKSYTDEIRFRDGRVFERYSQPQKINGTTVGWVSSYRDITEKRQAEESLRESEERFREIVEQSDDALFLCSSDCLVIALNRSAASLFGYEKEELINRSLGFLFGSGGYHQLCNALDSVGSVNGVRIPKMSVKCKNGDSLYIAMRVKTIELSGEAVLLFAMNDITEKVRLDDHTREIQAKLIQANKMTSLGLLVSGIAHEINNPNNYIMISSELVSRAWKDCLPILKNYQELHGDFMAGGVPFSSFEPEAQELIDGITKGSGRIRDIVNSLKEFSRDNRGLKEVSVDLNRVVNQSTTIIAHHIKRLTHHFQQKLEDDLPMIRGNKHQLEQVLINLILNALQSLRSPDESVTVSTRYEPESEEVVVTVADQGCGIASGICTQIMEPFFTTRLDSGGTGLGLSICKTIVNEHVGTISFESEVGTGTVFTLRFSVISMSPRGTSV